MSVGSKNTLLLPALISRIAEYTMVNVKSFYDRLNNVETSFTSDFNGIIECHGVSSLLAMSELLATPLAVSEFPAT